jgi:Flp pilus assembly protein TadD
MAWFARGIANTRLGKRELAERDFRQAAALDPGVEAKANKFGLAH